MKKKIILLSILLTSLVTSCGESNKETPKVEGNTFYMSFDGKVDNDGSKEKPFDAHTAFSKAQKGDTLKVLPGRYKLDERIFIEEIQSGDAFNYITVENDSKTEAAIFDFSSMEFEGTNRGISVNGSYWNFKNIEITGAGDNGMYIGGSHNIIEDCLFYDNRDSGLQLGRASGGYSNMDFWPSNNIIRRCTSFNNYDDKTYGENADGFAAKLTVGYGNIFDSCVAYRNSDDGWDLFAKPDSGNIGTVVLYNCVSFENGFLLNKVKEEGSIKETFVTRDGDGIGFKLGGSTMKGDVILENCLAFNNRLQGIGDNSNPGVIKIKNCTAYNNNAMVDQYGNIDKTLIDSDSEASNFDLARTEDSYNSYSGLLSYVSNKSNNPDKFKGSVDNSIFYSGNGKYTRIESPIDASSYESDKKGNNYDGMSDIIFKNVEALNGLNNRTVDSIIRNPDRSIYLGDFLILKDNNLNLGAKFNKDSYSEYEHYELRSAEDADDNTQIKLKSVYDILELNCNEANVYQNFLVPVRINGCVITWASSDDSIVSFNDQEITSLSQSKEVVVNINRPKNDTDIKITALIEFENEIMKKEFNIKVMADSPSIGDVYVEGVEGKIILSQYDKFNEPKLVVTNGSQYSESDLDTSLYSVTTKYEFAENKLAEYYEVSGVYSSHPGVYKVTKTIKSLISNDQTTKEITYYIFVSSMSGTIDFVNKPIISVNRDGFSIEAELTNVCGSMYVHQSSNEIETAETIKENGEKIKIENDEYYGVFRNNNSTGYYIHIVLENEKETYLSEVSSVGVQLVEISTTQQFFELITNETNSSTIYILTQDLDFTNFNWSNSAKQTFVGVLNGNGHTIKNVKFGSENKNNGIFYKVNNATIMNVDFDNIDITLGSDKGGIIGTMSGGYVHNVHVSNINIVAKNRAAAIVGQIESGFNYFSQISVINNDDYTLSGGERIAGIVGFIQNSSNAVNLVVEVLNCQVISNVDGTNYIGGIIGRFDDRKDFMKLKIEKCYYEGQIVARNYVGGILAGYNNGISQIEIRQCISAFEAIYNGNVFVTGLKNCSPIVGRNPAHSGTGYSLVESCYATYAEYNENYDSTFMLFESNIKNENFYKNNVKFDLETIWIFDSETKTIRLR